VYVNGGKDIFESGRVDCSVKYSFSSVAFSLSLE